MMDVAGAIVIGVACGWLAWSAREMFEERAIRRQWLLTLDPARAGDDLWKKLFLRRVQRPQKIKMFPDFLDLFGLGLSAGLTLERAWIMAQEKLPDGPLKEDLSIYERALEWGRSRNEAFRAVAERLDDPQLSLVLILVEQAMAHGQELKDVVFGQAMALRRRRWVELERRAQTAGTRLLIPIFVLILPAVFLILFAPFFLSLSGGASMFF